MNQGHNLSKNYLSPRILKIKRAILFYLYTAIRYIPALGGVGVGGDNDSAVASFLLVLLLAVNVVLLLAVRLGQRHHASDL